MKEYLKFNLNSYFNKDSCKYKVVWLLPLFILFGLILFSFKYYAYNVYEANAIFYCEETCTLNFYHPVSESFIYDYLKINNKTYEITDITYGDIELDNNNVGIQKITLNVKEYKGKNNEVVKLQLYKNKEKIIKKIYEIIKER